MAMNLFGLDDETQGAVDTYSRMPVQQQAAPEKKRGPFAFLGDLLGATWIGKEIRQNRERESINEQLKTFADNPYESIRSLAKAGHGAAAVDLYDAMKKREAEELKATAAAGADHARTRKVDDEIAQLQRERFAGRLAGVADDPVQYNAMRPFLSAHAKQFGIELPEEHDPAALDSILGEFIRPEKRYEADALEEYRDHTIAQRAAANRIAAARVQVDAAKAGEEIRNKGSQRESRDTETEILRRTGRRPGTDSVVTHKGKRGSERKPPSKPPRKPNDTWVIDGVIAFTSPDGKSWKPTGK